jgi:hypothetical protein
MSAVPTELISYMLTQAFCIERIISAGEGAGQFGATKGGNLY